MKIMREAPPKIKDGTNYIEAFLKGFFSDPNSIFFSLNTDEVYFYGILILFYFSLLIITQCLCRTTIMKPEC